MSTYVDSAISVTWSHIFNLARRFGEINAPPRTLRKGSGKQDMLRMDTNDSHLG